MSVYISRPSNFNGFCLVFKRKGDKKKALICYDEFKQITGYTIPKGSGVFFDITKVTKRNKHARSRTTD